jgi:hypothetical protein
MRTETRTRTEFAAAFAAAFLAACAAPPRPARTTAVRLVDTAATSALAAMREEGATTIVLRVEERDRVDEVRRAAVDVRAAGMRLGYWVEVARSPSLAAAHSEHVATLQAHDEWRSAHEQAPVPAAGEVLVVDPWVPITTREGYALQLDRVGALLNALPPADEIWLCDLQSAPSACGCGHPLCRWSTDYYLQAPGRGPKRPSGEPSSPDAAARFCAEVEARARGARVVPVFVPECGEDDGLCHGVPCFDGACWPALARQWAPVLARFDEVAVFVPTRSIGAVQDAGQVLAAVARMTRFERAGAPRIDLDPTRMTVVLESPLAELPDAIVSEAALEQGWQPRLRR